MWLILQVRFEARSTEPSSTSEPFGSWNSRWTSKAAGHCHWRVRSSSASAQCYCPFGGSRHDHVQARRVHQLWRWQRPEFVALELEQQLLLELVQSFPHPVVPAETVRLLYGYLNTYVQELHELLH